MKATPPTPSTGAAAIRRRRRRTYCFPERDEEFQILRENLPFSEERILEYVTDFLQLAHAADERYTVRDGINVARFAIKLKSLATQRTHETEALEIAVTLVLGEEALRYVRSNRPSAI